MPRFLKPDRSAAIGARLCIARVTARLSRVQLGAALDLSAAQIEKYELGSTRLPAIMLVDLARLLGRLWQFFIETDDIAVARLQLLELPVERVWRRQILRAVTALKQGATEGPFATGRPGSHEDRISA